MGNYAWTTGETITAEKLNNTGGYDIVLQLNTNEGTIISITQISMDETAVLAKARNLQPLTSLVYGIEEYTPTNTGVCTGLSTVRYWLDGEDVIIQVTYGSIDENHYEFITYAGDGEWFVD